MQNNKIKKCEESGLVFERDLKQRVTFTEYEPIRERVLELPTVKQVNEQKEYLKTSIDDFYQQNIEFLH